MTDRPGEPDFHHVADIVRSLCVVDLGAMRSKAHRYGVKLWFGDERPDREHYEAQVIGRRPVDGSDGVALEIGFHAEHRDEARNESVLATLMRHEGDWRPALGDETTTGEFFGAEHWRRVSDVWLDPDLSDEDIDVEIAGRLADYVDALEPVRRADVVRPAAD